MTRLAHLPALDGLRGLAILLVIAHNTQMLESPTLHGAAKAVYIFMTQGWVGVQLFLVLSGFLITGILLDTVGQEGALRKFIARRALRIFPLYYGALLVIFLILPALNLQPAIYQAQAPYQIWLWTYLSNWTDPIGIGPRNLAHFWSLAVEEQFYLFWPLLVFALRSPMKVAWACLALALASLLSRAGLQHAGAPPDVLYSWTICRIDALVLGGFAAAVWRIPAWFAWVQRQAWAIVGLVFAMLGVLTVWTHAFPRTGERTVILGFTGLAIMFAVMIYIAAWHDAHDKSPRRTLWHRFLVFSPLRSIGKYSYGMYVFHKPLHDLFSKRALQSLHIQPEAHLMTAVGHVGAMVLISYAVAWLSYNLFEVHFLNLKRYFD